MQIPSQVILPKQRTDSKQFHPNRQQYKYYCNRLWEIVEVNINCELRSYAIIKFKSLNACPLNLYYHVLW